MNHMTSTLIRFLVLASFCITLSPYADPQNPQAERYGSVDTNKYPTNITADYFNVLGKEHKFFYQGNVKALHNGMVLNADRVDGTYDQKNQIDKLIATGNVVVDNGKGIHATGGKGIYGAKTNTIIMTDSPEVTENGSTVAADKITVYLKENRSEATGRVRMRVAPKDLQPAKLPPTPVPTPVVKGK